MGGFVSAPKQTDAWSPPLGNGPLVKVDALCDADSDIYVCEAFFVIGPMWLVRTMTVVHWKGKGGRVTLINCSRVDAKTEEAIKKLGKVTDIVRLTNHHGLDELYYSESDAFAKPIRFWTPAPMNLSGEPNSKWHGHTVPFLEYGEGKTLTEALPGCISTMVITEPKRTVEVVLFLESKKVILTADCIQDYVPGLKISDLDCGKFSAAGAWVLGFTGHLVTPPFFFKGACTDEVPFFERFGKVMNLDWTSTICAHGGVTLKVAKQERLAYQATNPRFPIVSYGNHKPGTS